MAKVALGYKLPGWTPQMLISYLYQQMMARGIKVQMKNPTSLRLTRGALLLWEGHAQVDAYQQGDFIELVISSSETRSFLTGGLIGRSRAVAARNQLMQMIISILGSPAYTRQV